MHGALAHTPRPRERSRGADPPPVGGGVARGRAQEGARELSALRRSRRLIWPRASRVWGTPHRIRRAVVSSRPSRRSPSRAELLPACTGDQQTSRERKPEKGPEKG